MDFTRYYTIRGKVKPEEHRDKELMKNWVKWGLKDDPRDVLKIYKETTHCIICDKLLTGKGNARKAMNHCHETKYFLNILCIVCNSQEHNDGYWKGG